MRVAGFGLGVVVCALYGISGQVVVLVNPFVRLGLREEVGYRPLGGCGRRRLWEGSVGHVQEGFEDGTSKPWVSRTKEMKVGSSTESATRRAIRLAWVAFVVQAVAVTFHQTWHAVGFDEPPSEIAHYLLLHFPLHLGVVLLGVAAVWLALGKRSSLALFLLVAGAVIQHAGIVVDTAAVFAEAPHGAAALLFVAGGSSALVAAAVRRRSQPPEAA